jgi:hypothetical protein
MRFLFSVPLNALIFSCPLVTQQIIVLIRVIVQEGSSPVGRQKHVTLKRNPNLRLNFCVIDTGDVQAMKYETVLRPFQHCNFIKDNVLATFYRCKQLWNCQHRHKTGLERLIFFKNTTVSTEVI